MRAHVGTLLNALDKFRNKLFVRKILATPMKHAFDHCRREIPSVGYNYAKLNLFSLIFSEINCFGPCGGRLGKRKQNETNNKLHLRLLTHSPGQK